MPRPVRLLLRGVDAFNRGGMRLVSYLLFESGFTSELIDMGFRDGMELEPVINGVHAAELAQASRQRLEMLARKIAQIPGEEQVVDYKENMPNQAVVQRLDGLLVRKRAALPSPG